MSFKDRIKWMFAEELQKMLKEKSLSDIRVGKLCLRCGVDRQVFYYHFRDKYDLIHKKNHKLSLWKNRAVALIR